ncbi:MAG: hypothetical protein KDB22_12935 [Planctomycetales bacterium]|nr:hypothetical protein [Planctomycetales bacterium]
MVFSESPPLGKSPSVVGQIQFDLRGIAALTIVVAAVFAIGRQFVDAGAILATVLGPAVVIFAIGTLRTRARVTLGVISVLVPLLSVVVGLFLQCLVWGVVYKITWIPITTTTLATVLTIALCWMIRSIRQLFIPLAVLFVALVGYVSYRFQVTSAERWAAIKFSVAGGRQSGWIRHQPLFKLPVAYGTDLRRSEGISLQWLQSARLLFGLSESASLTIQTPLSDEEWKKVSQLKGLRQLSIRGFTPNDNSLEAMGHLENLEKLLFHDCKLKHGFEQLKSLQQLKSLTFMNSTLETCTGLSQLKSLEGVGLYNSTTNRPKELVDEILQMPLLKYLHATPVQVDDQDLQRLVRAKQSWINAGHGNWLETFSVNAASAGYETILAWVEQQKSMRAALGNLELDSRKKAALHDKLDEAAGFQTMGEQQQPQE